MRIVEEKFLQFVAEFLTNRANPRYDDFKIDTEREYNPTEDKLTFNDL